MQGAVELELTKRPSLQNSWSGRE